MFPSLLCASYAVTPWPLLVLWTSSSSLLPRHCPRRSVLHWFSVELNDLELLSSWERRDAKAAVLDRGGEESSTVIPSKATSSLLTAANLTAAGGTSILAPSVPECLSSDRRRLDSSCITHTPDHLAHICCTKPRRLNVVRGMVERNIGVMSWCQIKRVFPEKKTFKESLAKILLKSSVHGPAWVGGVRTRAAAADADRETDHWQSPNHFSPRKKREKFEG